MKRIYFGTDGIRGQFGGPVINEEFASRLGAAVGRWLRESGGTGQRAVLIGRDTRASGVVLARAVAAGLAAEGWRVVDLGVLPTPAVSRAVKAGGAALGVMITASHNPAEDNGIKVFNGTGVKLTDAQEAEIELQLSGAVIAVGAGALPAGEALEDYLSSARALLPVGALTGWKIVLDTANGATCGASPVVLRGLGAKVVGIGDRPDGTNINADVGSEHPAALAARVVAEGARLGIAHDGDGDRCVLCDEKGGVLNGDEILTILATHALAHGRLVKKILVATVQSNLGVDAAIAAAGGTVRRSAVGDRYVIEEMLKCGATLGGESSGHVICLENAATGDGLVAALKVIEVMLATGKPLSELRGALRKFPQLTAALTVQTKTPLESLPGLQAVIAALERELGADGRLLVRYSGTEAKLRLLVEGLTEPIVRAALARLETAVRAELTVI
jgi:phosphoglucosamine mutase